MNEHCFSDDNPVLDPDVKALVAYTNSTTEPTDTDSVDWSDVLDVICKDLNSTLMIPLFLKAPPKNDVTYQLDISFQIGAYALDKAYVNSTTWIPAQIPTLNQALTALSSSNSTLSNSLLSPGTVSSTLFTPADSQLVISIPSIQTVDILINNLDEGAHPFHLHGHQFWELASGSGAFDWVKGYESLEEEGEEGMEGKGLERKMRRDTITVNAYGWSLIRFVADNPGLWALHCHISVSFFPPFPSKNILS